MYFETLFYEFCGNVTLLNLTLLRQDRPYFSQCLVDTLPVWISCGYLWITVVPFLIFLYWKKRPPISFSYLHILKTTLCIGLLCTLQIHMTFRQTLGSACGNPEDLSAAAKSAMWIKFATIMLATALLQVQKQRGLKTSAVIFLFWLITVTLESLQLYTYVIQETTCRTHTVFYIYYGMLTLQVLAHCWAEKSGDITKTGERPCPEDNASILNRFTFNWVMPLIISCYRKKFSSFDMWGQTELLKSSLIGPELEENWNKEFDKFKARQKQEKSSRSFEITESKDESSPLLSTEDDMGDISNKRGKKTLLLKAVFRTYWPDYADFTLYAFFENLLFFFQPFVLRLLIDYLDSRNKDSNPLWIGILYVILLFVVLETSSLFYNVLLHHTSRLGLKIKTALMYIIYKKALTLSKSDNTSSVGDIVNLMSVDCQRIQDSLFYSYFCVAAIMVVVGSLYFLWLMLGIAVVGGMAMILFIFPINIYIARKQHGIQKYILKMKGKRVRLINEVLSGIKVLKMYAWELSFMKKVKEIRDKELNTLWTNAILMAISTAVCTHGQYLIHYALILIYVLIRPDHYISSQDIFVSLALVTIVKYALTATPTLFNGLVQAYVSLSRIEQFLCSADLPSADLVQSKRSDKSLKVSNGSFTWDNIDSTPSLRNINFEVKPGQLVAVVGHCGSGKTSLISALLGEMKKLSGTISYTGNIAYVPQEAWIQNMTLRDNILFGKEFNPSKYWKVIENCALKTDLEILDGGDKTEIGEKGTNISGGQKQRISLARAVYNNADIYLLDDPLSAVDAHVGKDLFKNVIGNTGMLKNKTRILVTHAIHWLPLVENIIVMENGTVSEIGTYDELMTHNGAFAQFLLQYLTQEPSDDLDDPEIKWIRENMLELVETVTTEGGASSDEAINRLKARRKKKKKLKRSISATSKLSQSQAHNTTTATTPIYNVSRLTTEEVVQEGSVHPKVFLNYFKAMGVVAGSLSMLIMMIYQGLNIYSMFWLTFWTEDDYLKNSSLSYTSEYNGRFTMYLVTYTLLGILQGITVYLAFYLALTRLVTASGNLHLKMLTSVLRSPMSFFDTVPVGRILNRFASDIDIMDNKLPESYRVWIGMVFSTLASLIVMVITTPIFIAVIVPAVLLCGFLLKFYLPTARKMKRVESVTRSPIFSHFSETLTGASVIRAYRCSDRFLESARQRIDKNIKFYYAAQCAQRWVAVRLECLGSVLVSAATLFVILSSGLNGAQLGLTVTYAVQLTFTLNNVVWAVAEMEMNVISVERVSEYTTLPSEATWSIDNTRPDSGWPSSGLVQYKNYSTRYRPGLDLVLKGMTCDIKSEEKIGVVGRTGAGKSSLALSLFRIIESAGGSILIDGINISKLGLHDLRAKLTILPQDPVLFSGSLRMNIDPMEQYSDVDIWKVVQASHLKSFVMSQAEQLLYDCGEAGSNLSVGQRQLVCLARTLLYKTKILILDEATAAVDMQTDELIQQTIRTQFNDCTIITIAHRLNTIMDYDRVMVLDKGQIKEFDKPRELLKKTDGVFHGMAKDAGLV